MLNLKKYALTPDNYTVKRALLWGFFAGHLKEAASQSNSWRTRIVHSLVAGAEFFPLLSQIASFAELLIAQKSSRLDLNNKVIIEANDEKPSTVEEIALKSFSIPKQQESTAKKAPHDHPPNEDLIEDKPLNSRLTYENHSKPIPKDHFPNKDLSEPISKLESNIKLSDELRTAIFRQKQDQLEIIANGYNELAELRFQYNAYEAKLAQNSHFAVYKIQKQYVLERIQLLEERIRQSNIVINKLDYKELVQQMTLNLLMDKLYLAEDNNESGTFLASTPIFLDVFANTRDTPFVAQNPEIQIYVNQFLEHLIPLFKESLDFAFSKTHNKDHKILGHKIHEAIKKLSVGQRLLVPVGCNGHATDLLIEKTAPSRFRLTHFNTGTGVGEFHHQLGNNLFQTYEVIEDVPAASLLCRQEWENHYTELAYAEDMNSAYEWIRDRIGRRGVIQGPSEYEEDYESIQKTDSCGVQVKMAIIRHEAMQTLNKTPIENHAFYKIFKNIFLLQYINKFDSLLNPESQQITQEIKEKLEGEMALLKIAGDKELYSQTLKQYGKIFTISLNKFDFDKIGLFARFAILRQLSIENVRKKELIDETILPESNKQFLEARLKYHAKKRKNISAHLKKIATQNDPELLANEMAKILVENLNSKIAIVAIVKLLANSTMPHLHTFFFELLAQEYKNNTPYVKSMIAQMERLGNSELAQAINTFWQSRSSLI